jgi:regulator of sigma E protease
MVVVISLLILSFLIFFHEFGHFSIAKLFGVKVEVFSIGFGKKLVCKLYKGTNYCLSTIPLGGYVQMKGQDDLNPSKTSYDKDSYNAKTPLQRIAILFAGPFANFLLAFFLYMAIGIIGVHKLTPQIGKIYPNSAAFQAQLKKGDTILSINGIKVESWDDLKNIIENSNDKLILKIKRDNKIVKKLLYPKIEKTKNIFGEEVKRKIIGILPLGNSYIKKYSFFESISFAYNETIRASKFIITGIEKMIEGVVPTKDIGGVIAIVNVTSQAASTGLVALLGLTALISVNLGILNLFPIPALDGGHIMFNLYELVTKRAPSTKVYERLTYAGWALLLTLMIFSTYNDLARLIG